MGYSHMFYAVNLKQLRAIPGSKDLILFEEIKTTETLDENELDALQ